MNRNTVFFASFFLLAFTMPAESFSPGSTRNNSDFNKTLAIPSVENKIPAEKKIESVEEAFEDFVDDSFDRMDLRGTGLKISLYRKALIGYQNLKHGKQISPFKSVLTIVDFTKSSKQRRLWVIDLKVQKLLFHTLVAHGRGSGNDMAVAFSNTINSYQSSLGFYVTANTYQGKHGLSLKLAGKDSGYNTNAMERAIVIHGADYVSKDFVQRQGRLGRSHGCPALPIDLNEKIIKVIKDGSCLYIDGGVSSYSSVYLNKNIALTQFARENKVALAGI